MHGANVDRRIGIRLYLAAQVLDLGVDQRRVARAGRIFPDVFQQLVNRAGLSGVDHQIMHQTMFQRSQLVAATGHCDIGTRKR